MKSFTLPITTVGQLLEQIANHFITIRRKEWHNLEAMIETCNYCSKPLSKEMDEINGIELVCNNRYCPGR